ncbi:hypothetical protein GCM10017620_31370 [Brevundimonas intermedia]|uniref:Flagellar hook-basal body complex protein FliE n=1 Tax=Brevundimonas intermedia TaxID=74315 RepID=A0ABQ5TCQ7_9CAUL|nr:flagellar hook-basal body complex protein FliE [Brevundimonas intermedia]GLK50163.1 hypothetical protein GCM10017620_31370 [Brevundimonas intermedia]
MSAALDPIAAVGAARAASLEPAIAVAPTAGFSRLLSEGVEAVNGELLAADRMTQAFALGEDVPIHQVTYALEHARLSFELMSQVRTRLLEAYQELMRMPV